jgi:peptide/nickel transport system permease protein
VLAAVVRRLGELVVVCTGVSVLTFLMIRLIPGDAVQIMLGANAEATPQQIAAMRARLGLDQSLFVQYAMWVGRALYGDLGTSVWTGRPVLEEILPRVGVTAELTVLALLLAAILAVPLGCLMATARRRWSDYTIRLVSIVGITTPSFWLGVMLLYAVSVAAPDAQMLGWVSFADDPLGNLQRVILPVTALALPVLASLARVVRASMVEVMRQDYIRTARAKGLPERDVIIVHALRNALLPFLTSFGIMAGYLFGGSVVVEQVFALPGLGRLMVGAIAERNYPLVQASILLATLTFVVVNTAVDLLYAAVDPRVSRA